MAEEEQEKSGKNLGKIFAIGFLSLNMLVLAAGSFLVYKATLGHETDSVTDKELNREIASFRESLRGEPVLYKMEPFNTNLDGVPRRLIRMEVNLEMLDEEGFEEVIGLGAQARDSIVRILNAKNFNDIETVQGKLHLKNQIITRINDFLDRGVVKNVYFSDFVVQ